MMLVCKTFRDVALHTHGLWIHIATSMNGTVFSPDNSGRWTAMSLARAKSAPLILSHRPLFDYQHDQTRRDADQKAQHEFMTANWPRAYAASLIVDYETQDLLRAWLGHPAPFLNTLRFTSLRNTANNLSMLPSVASSLVELTLDGVTVHKVSIASLR
jgi:hypothetical protein